MKEVIYVDSGQPSTSTTKYGIFRKKVMLRIWWDMKGVMYYELLNLSEMINITLYQRQSIGTNWCKNPSITSNGRKMILQYDNAKLHVVKTIKETCQKLMDLEWEVLRHPVYSFDLALSDFHVSLYATLSRRHTSPISTNFENGSMIGSPQKIGLSFNEESSFYQKIVENDDNFHWCPIVTYYKIK